MKPETIDTEITLYDQRMDEMNKTPLDLLIKPITNLSKDSIWVKVVVRINGFNRPYDLIECHNFNTVRSNVDNVQVVCVVNNSKGIYELIIKKNINKTPVNLEPGDYVDLNIIIIDDTGLVFTYASGVIRIEQT